MNNKNIGIIGEEKAINYLKKQKYVILKKNFKTYFGEIDIIAKVKDIIVFAEVKSRNNSNYGYPFEAVDRNKQKKIINSAYVYIKQNRLKDYRYRFDIIEVFLNEGRINHIENAFWL